MASEIARSELAEHGITVVTVYPGPVHSPLERGAREGYGGGGLVGKLVPTGDPTELARRIMVAIDKDEPRVIYPRLYNVGWSATNVESQLFAEQMTTRASPRRLARAAAATLEGRRFRYFGEGSRVVGISLQLGLS